MLADSATTKTKPPHDASAIAAFRSLDWGSSANKEAYRMPGKIKLMVVLPTEPTKPRMMDRSSTNRLMTNVVLRIPAVIRHHFPSGISSGSAPSIAAGGMAFGEDVGAAARELSSSRYGSIESRLVPS